MNIKKLTAIAAAVIMAAGICTGVPTGTETGSPLAITAEAADSDFVTDVNADGNKLLIEYKGKGGDVVIPEGIEWVEPYVFKENNTITSVTFPESCWSVGGEAFHKCANLKKVVFNGNAGIGTYTFSGCVSLESVTIKGGIVFLQGGAFNECYALKTVTVDKVYDGEFYIGASAFNNCYSLTSINIPDNCTEIYGCAFLNCFSLEKLTIPPKTKINTENKGSGHFGWIKIYKTNDDALLAYFGDKKDYILKVADGKTTGWSMLIKMENVNGENVMLMAPDKYTPKQLTVTVTKGSPAEKWAKENGVKYEYAKDTVITEKTTAAAPKAAAPANIKASKTNNSVTLTWDKADGAAIYRVYMYNEKTGKYEKYKDVKNAKCTVTGLKAGTKYKFKVVSYSKEDGKYVKGESSKAVSVTTKK